MSLKQKGKLVKLPCGNLIQPIMPLRNGGDNDDKKRSSWRNGIYVWKDVFIGLFLELYGHGIWLYVTILGKTFRFDFYFKLGSDLCHKTLEPF